MNSSSCATFLKQNIRVVSCNPGEDKAFDNQIFIGGEDLD